MHRVLLPCIVVCSARYVQESDRSYPVGLVKKENNSASKLRGSGGGGRSWSRGVSGSIESSLCLSVRSSVHPFVYLFVPEPLILADGGHCRKRDTLHPFAANNPTTTCHNTSDRRGVRSGVERVFVPCIKELSSIKRPLPSARIQRFTVTVEHSPF